jgi:hypothetical protein
MQAARPVRPERAISIHMQMSSKTSSTPAFPIPASARAHPITSVSGTIKPAKVTLAPTTSPPATTTTTPATTSPATTTIPATTVKSVVAGRPVTHTSKHSESLSTAAIVAAVVAAVLVLACVAWALARRRAFEPRWMLSLRHAMDEAGFRASATWAEFSDWARLGH